MGWLGSLFGTQATARPDTTPLNADEQRRVDALVAEYPEASGDPAFLRGLTALAVAQYGDWMAQTRKDLAAAMVAVSKAWVLCPLPIYLHDLSRYLEQSGDAVQARAVLGEFLRAQAGWQAGPHDRVFLAGRDVATAVADARQRLGLPGP